jgi:5-hydroxyisourate hydrolase
MSPITTHVLDTSLGKPAVGVPVVLEKIVDGRTIELAMARTDADGRVRDWWDGIGFAPGVYRIRFDAQTYFQSIDCSRWFYPEVVIHFEIADRDAHYHVPLLISPFGYSTYRGS